MVLAPYTWQEGSRLQKCKRFLSSKAPLSSGSFPQHQVTRASLGDPNSPPPPPSSGTGPRPPSASSSSPPTTPPELHCACAADAQTLRRSGQNNFRFPQGPGGRPESRGKRTSGLRESSGTCRRGPSIWRLPDQLLFADRAVVGCEDCADPMGGARESRSYSRKPLARPSLRI